MPVLSKAMVLNGAGRPLTWAERTRHDPAPDEIAIEVSACGVCRTDLHIVDGELAHPKLPLVPGHEIVGRIVALGPGVEKFQIGQRVGVPWLGRTCGNCRYCLSGRENLCEGALFTGYDIDGGYSDYTIAHQDFCFPISGDYSDAEAAPLLCAGLIGYRSLRLAGDGERLGLYGFGAAAHIVIQIAKYQDRKVFAFTSPGDTQAQQFALSLGALWAGSSTVAPPEELDAAIIFAPVGSLVPAALRAVAPGGTVVCAGIHMSDIPGFPYDILWRERTVRSVANLTRSDGAEFLALAPQIPIKTEIEEFPLDEANQALDKLRRGDLRGAAVLVPTRSSRRP